MDIDVLCKVVDNYGDIGVVYRLARALSELPDPPRLRLIVDDLTAFASLDPSIRPGAPTQMAHGWEVYPWEGPGTDEAARSFKDRRPRILIEAFACGRPDWLEALLFDDSHEACLIVDLEHLTAEAWAGDFHRMPSLTRSATVRKSIFLPGFTAGTGGLIVDAGFARSRELAKLGPGRAALRRELLAGLPAAPPIAAVPSPDAAELFWISIFAYERDYGRIVADLAVFEKSTPILALAAAGKSQACLARAWEAAGRPFPLLSLPFLPQEEWDRLLLACDFSIVRGEDSWSRASLSGRPFLWQAYPQEGRHQLVKVRAFLEVLRPHFPPQSEGSGEGSAASGGLAFSELEALYLSFNDRAGDGPETEGGEELLPVLEAYSALLPGFIAFSSSLGARSDLARGLVTFLGKIV